MTDTALVELRGVCKEFSTSHVLPVDEETRKRRLFKKKVVCAADNISFSIAPGEIFGLLGPNGAGKTTAVKMISGLVRPDAGQAFVKGLNVEKKRRQILRHVGVVLEGTRTSLWPLTPFENLVYYGMLKDVRGSVLKERAHDLLDFIGLQDKKNVQVRRLSRGQKQKLAICIAMIADPLVLLLDEPTTGLDVQSSRAIKDKVREITREQGRSVLVTTHDMHVAQELCDRIAIINHGKLIACRPTDSLLEVFSEQVFAFRLDRRVPLDLFSGIPGIIKNEYEDSEEPELVFQLVGEQQDLRSDALYKIIRIFEEQKCLLRSVSQRKQNLESIFLRLTSDDPDADVLKKGNTCLSS